MPRSLADVQTSFIDALKQPEASVPEAIAVKDGKPVNRRFDVYRNNVAAGMIEALRATFPAVEQLVGAEFFAASSRVYLDHDPPRSPLLFRYGETFGKFLDDFPPAAKTPYLGDVARLEWARLQAHHAADGKPLSIDALAVFLDAGSHEPADVGELKLTLHPSLDLITSRWPVFSLWAASTGFGKSEDVDMKRSENALIIRPELQVETRRLPETGAAFIATLGDGATLEYAATCAAAVDADFDLVEHLQGLFAVGAVSAINKNQA